MRDPRIVPILFLAVCCAVAFLIGYDRGQSNSHDATVVFDRML